MTTDRTDTAELRAEVAEKYRTAARTAAQGSACCSPGETDLFGSSRYSDLGDQQVPDAAMLASLGCGNPTAVAELRAGERVLDLGSGGGLDVILSARRVGPQGRAYGLDALDEMLLLARRNIAEAGVANVELLKGDIEAVPLPAESVDVVISNCVINLAIEKAAVFAEIYRVLVPGGRVGVTDVVAEDRLTPEMRRERGSHSDCIAGALSRGEYLAALRAAGLTDAEVTFTHQVADGLHGAIVRARKPLAARPFAVASKESATCC
ncbi:MAG TPA: methyltransferase domain-containing protein [Micromonosporaceae bacterium]